jgi:hypothetical protein
MTARPRNRITEVLRGLERSSAGRADLKYSFGNSGESSIRVAASTEDRLRAWGLVYHNYLEKEYASPNRQRLWYSIFDALPETVTLLAERDGRTVGTATVVPDSPLELPADGIYDRELAELRRSGRGLCEIISFAVAEERMNRATRLVKHLCWMSWLVARELIAADDLVITVNPRHAAYYRRVMLFESLGEERAYDKVGGAPAVLLRLDLLTQRERYRARYGHLQGERNLYRFYFGSERQEVARRVRRSRRPLTEAALKRYFIRERPLLPDASPTARGYVEACYPAYDLTRQTSDTHLYAPV